VIAVLTASCIDRGASEPDYKRLPSPSGVNGPVNPYRNTRE
jgi:hypothetical protein